jgi:hypothetical protein
VPQIWFGSNGIRVQFWGCSPPRESRLSILAGDQGSSRANFSATDQIFLLDAEHPIVTYLYVCGDPTHCWMK